MRKLIKKCLKKIWDIGFIRWTIIILIAFFLITGLRETIKYPGYVFNHLWWFNDIKATIVVTKDEFVSKPAIEFTAEDISGRKISIAGLRGKPILLTFFAFG